MAGSSQLQSHRSKHHRNGNNDGKSCNRSSSRNEISQQGESESDTSASPINEFSNTPTYRVPTKSSRGMQTFFRIIEKRFSFHLTIFRYFSSRFKYRIK